MIPEKIITIQRASEIDNNNINFDSHTTSSAQYWTTEARGAIDHLIYEHSLESTHFINIVFFFFFSFDARDASANNATISQWLYEW